jgi:hypothetical protein
MIPAILLQLIKILQSTAYKFSIEYVWIPLSEAQHLMRLLQHRDTLRRQRRRYQRRFNELLAHCIAQGISVPTYLYDAIDYFREDLDSL